MNLGKRLRTLRLQSGLTAKELSDLSGVTRSLISELETGKRQSTSADTIDKLARALCVSPSYFFESDYSLSTQITYGIPSDIHEFLLREDSYSYIRIARKAQETGLPPEILEELLDLVKRIRSTPRYKLLRKSHE